MDSKLLHSIVIVCLLLALFVLSGCTVVGLAIGGNMDRDAEKRAVGPAERLVRLKPGRKITVTDKNGQEATGVYEGLKPRPASEYTSLDGESQDSLSNLYTTTLPAIGDTLSITLYTGKTVHGQLVGYDLQRMWLKSLTKGSLTNIPLCDITEIADRDGVVPITRNHVKMMGADDMPSVMTVLLRQDSSTVPIPTDSISYVRVHVKPYRWAICGGVGLLIDAAAVAAIVACQMAKSFEGFNLNDGQ